MGNPSFKRLSHTERSNIWIHRSREASPLKFTIPFNPARGTVSAQRATGLDSWTSPYRDLRTSGRPTETTIGDHSSTRLRRVHTAERDWSTGDWHWQWKQKQKCRVLHRISWSLHLYWLYIIQYTILLQVGALCHSPLKFISYCTRGGSHKDNFGENLEILSAVKSQTCISFKSWDSWADLPTLYYF